MADDLVAHASELLERIRYLTLATVTGDGRPWASPVYFAADGLTDFYWCSTLTSHHSQNLRENEAVSVTVFDSTVPPYHGRAVYAEGVAEVVPERDLLHGLTVYPGSIDRGGSRLVAEDLTGDAPWRLYRMRAVSVWVLCPREPRQPCPLHGRSDDHRARVWPQADRSRTGERDA